MAQRFLSIWFPRLGAERWLRMGACSIGHPLVTVAGRGRDARIVSTSAAAEAVGLRTRIGLDAAFDLYPGLAVLPADQASESKLLHALARLARIGGNDAIAEMPDALLVHIGDGPLPTATECDVIARSMTATAALGLTARPGIADTPRAAEALARYGAQDGGGSGRIAAPGRTRDAIRSLPVDALRLEAPSLRRLARLGVRRIGEIVDWPDPALRRYLGANVADHVSEALGAARAEPEVVFGDVVTPFPGSNDILRRAGCG